MLNSFLNQSAFGNFLQQGAAVSYDQFQQNLVTSQTQIQLQQLNNIQQEKNYKAQGAWDQYNQFQNLKQLQSNRIMNAYGQQSVYENEMNNFSTQLTQINANVLQSNALNSKEAGISNLVNTNVQMNQAIGNIEGQYGATDIVANSGSALNLARYTSQVIQNKGENNYTGALNQANADLMRASQIEATQQMQTMSLEQRQNIEKQRIQSNMSINFGNLGGLDMGF